MSDIFISYSHQDRQLLELLHKWLADEGFNATYDRRSLNAGDDHRNRIRNEIASARVTMVLWTENSIKNRDWVAHEASMAVAAQNYMPIVSNPTVSREIPDPYSSALYATVDDRDLIRQSLLAKDCLPRRHPQEAIDSRILQNSQPIVSQPHGEQARTSLIGRLTSMFGRSRRPALRSPLMRLFDTRRWSHHMPQRETRFLKYDPDWLCRTYHSENALPGGQPYSQEFSFASYAANGIEPRIKLEIAPGQFSLQPWRSVGDEVVSAGRDALIKSGKVTSETGSTIRLERAYVNESGEIVLRVQQATYGDQVRSNLISDFALRTSDGQDQTLRKLMLAEHGSRLPPLSDPRLANTLGVATILFYQFNGVWTPALWPRNTNLGVFEGGWHCSSSGAAEWWDDKSVPTFENLILGDMLREIEEELRVPLSRLQRLVPIALCREFARLGKPQLFFAGLVDMSHDELVASAREAGQRAKAAGQKQEALEGTIYQYPKDIVKRMTALQKQRGRARHDATYFEAKELFGRNGLTTECVTNLYYATQALPYL